MAPEKMHADELETDAALVRRLLAVQFPNWADLPVEPVPFFGTDNAIYRLGNDMAVRLPRRKKNVATLEKERRWLPTLAPHLPLAVPLPLARGAPAEDYPFTWAIYSWLEGEPATAQHLGDLCRAAIDLAKFVSALQRIDPTAGPPPGGHNAFRGVPLAERDETTRAAITKLRDSIDVDAVCAAWEAALGTPEWKRAPVWIHGDLDSRNLLVQNGRLSAAIDFGCLGVGDPACDVMVAWKILTPDVRNVFRTALSIDEATWARARGWALSQALMALSYYTPKTNPVLFGEAERWLAKVLADHASTSGEPRATDGRVESRGASRR
jgi:aminoglycoside phosphotransferase (APT) family kinase protein